MKADSREVRVRRADLGDQGDARKYADMAQMIEDEGRGRYAYGQVQALTDKEAKLVGIVRENGLVLFAVTGTGEDEVVVGVAVCQTRHFSSWWAEPVLNLHDFYVLGEYRRLGTGKLMFAELLRIAAEEGYCRLNLETSTNNVGAIKFYADHGNKEAQSLLRLLKFLKWIRPLTWLCGIDLAKPVQTVQFKFPMKS